MKESAIKRKLTNKNIIIVGTGVGGSGIAALLANDGATPLVLESNPFVGGKAASITANDCILDTGIHITPRGEKGPIAHLAKQVGADLSFVRPDSFMKLKYRGKSAVLDKDLMSPSNLIKLARTLNPSFRSIPGLIRFFVLLRSIKTENDVAPYYGMSARELICRYTTDRDILSLMTIFGMMMHVLLLEQISAADFLWALSNWFRDSATAYPKGGYGQVCQSYLATCEKNGGTVRLKQNVTRIVVENNQVKGVETKEGFIPGDMVICNAGIRRTVELAGEDHFPESYVRTAKNYKESLSGVVVQYGLDYCPVDAFASLIMEDTLDSFATVERAYEGRFGDDPIADMKLPLVFFSPTFVDSSLAPPGQHILLATMAPITANTLDDETSNKFLDLVEKRVAISFPGIEQHIKWKIRRGAKYYAQLGGRGTCEAIGWGQRYDQDGDKRMSSRTPVKGLYVVGTDTGYAGIGTELAAESSLRAHKLILEDIN